MPIYGYEKANDVQNDKYPANLMVCVETSVGIYFKDQSDPDVILKTTDEGLTVSTVSDRNAGNITAMNIFWHDRANEYIYFCENNSFTSSTDFYRIEYTNSDTITAQGSVNVQTILWFDLFIIGGTLYYLVINGGNSFDVYKYSGAVWALDATHNTYDSYDAISMVVVEGNNAWFVGYGFDGVDPDDFIFKFDSSVPSLTSVKTFKENVGESVDIDISRRGVTYDGTDYLTFTLIDDKYYIYSISGDTVTEGDTYNIALMPDRNTDTSNNPPFNLEKGYDVSNRYIYQISKNRSPAQLYKIADLTNSVADGTVVSITDTYLFIKRSSNDIELWKLQSADDYILDPEIYHSERDYPWADIVYDSNNLYWEVDMFVQIIGTLTSAGSTTSNTIIFEGYIINIEDENEESTRNKVATLVSPAYFDLKYYKHATTETGRTDQHISTIIAELSYITEGTLSNGTAIASVDWTGYKKAHRVFDELGVGDKFTWYLTPQGAFQYNNNTVDSTVNYSDTNCFDIIIGKREVRVNKVIAKGAYIDGVPIESDPQEDEEQQQLHNTILLDISLSWINTKALADTWASSLLDLLGSDDTFITIGVQDNTNYMIQPGEEITYVSTVKNITSAQFKINGIRYNYKTNIAFYDISSSTRYELEDFEDQPEETLSEQVYQVSDTVNTINSDYLTSSNISDAVYGVGWNGDTTNAPSKNAVYDKIEIIVDDTAISSSDDGVTDKAKSANTIWDKLDNYVSPIGWTADAGATDGGYFMAIPSSDNNARTTASFVCPETRTDWRLMIQTRESNGDNNSGVYYIGATADGEVWSTNNIVNGTAMDITHGAANEQTDTKSGTFSLTKGDNIFARWEKDANDGGGTLYVMTICLVHD